VNVSESVPFPPRPSPLLVTNSLSRLHSHRPISAAFDFEVKSVVLDKRAQVWAEVESAWIAVEESVLQECREYYAAA
jgi:hypothetical protein